MLDPAPPVLRGVVQEAFAQAGERFLDRRAPGERQMAALGERERLTTEIGRWDVGGEPQRTGKAIELDVVRALQRLRCRLRPAEARVAQHPDAGRAVDRLDDAEQLRRPEHAFVLRKARCEIEHTERPVRSAKRGFKHIAVVEIALNAVAAVGGTDEKTAAIALIEQRRKHRIGVEAWQATPHHRTRVFD